MKISKLKKCNIFALIFSFSLFATAQVTFPVERPSYKPGEAWIYRVLDAWNNKELRQTRTEFVASESDRLVFISTNLATSNKSTFRTNLDTLPCTRMQNSDLELCGGAYKFPMAIDFKNTYENIPWDNGRGHNSGECNAKGVEKITIPAGEFDTLRIECKGFWTRVFDGSGSGSWSETIWYSPKIQRHVKRNYEDRWNGRIDNKTVIELLEYKATP
jgi:hypothetical protein